MNIISSKDVTYDCALLTKESLDVVEEILQSTDFLAEIQSLGVEVPQLSFQDNMHCTLRYLKGSQDDEKRAYQLSNDELHQEGTLCVEGVGAYIKDGILRNIGLYVNDELSMNEDAFQAIRNELFSNDISHVTISINREKDNNGKRLANAVDTQKCFIPLGDDPQDKEFSYAIKFDEPITLSVTAEAIVGTQVVDVLSDYPMQRAERENWEAENNNEQNNCEWEEEER